MLKRKFQVGVMGSAADLKYTKEIEMKAEQIGKLLAEKNCITIYGAEKDYDSLSTSAARGAKQAGGLTVGVTYGKGKDIYDQDNNTDVIICSGLERGGGREFVLVNSCDAIIAISGGSGTMSEIAIAYQLNIPVVVINDCGGWAQELSDRYIDPRQRRMTYGFKTPEEAVDKVLQILNLEN